MEPSLLLSELGLEQDNPGVSSGQTWYPGLDGSLSSLSPVDGKLIARTGLASRQEYETVVGMAAQTFLDWRLVPAPGRGEILRQIGEALRQKKQALGQLVSWEMGKSLQEGLGEVQEMIDICDFAVGLSRQLHGLTLPSERPEHRIMEQWHPLGPVGILSAFNFPVAVWSWNAFLAWVCGDVTLWKPSEKVPLCALACQKLVSEVFSRNGWPDGISSLVLGGVRAGTWMAKDQRIPLVSATGSVGMGREVGTEVARRLGRALLELGGNNALIIAEDADLELALRASVFGAVGTAGQRCTTTRRLIIQESIYEEFTKRLAAAYRRLKIGNPLQEQNHMGPLIDREAVIHYLQALKAIEEQGGTFLLAGGILEGPEYSSGTYVKPCIAEVGPELPIVLEETFAPILYLIRYRDLEEAIRIQNLVPQGLASAILTRDMQQAERFLAPGGSDCGIANVNIGTSGAEIGGAFGGEKDSGGGRESGSDAWKNYMRRQTVTINYSSQLPLAQGIRFDL